MIYICIPTHNEQQTVGVVLWKLRQVLTDFPRDYQLLVADDASSDKTADVLEPYTRVLPLTVIRSEQRQGSAASLEMLLREAVRRSEYPKRDVIVTLQADFSEEPDDLVPLVKRLEAGADVAVGNKVSATKEARARRFARSLASFFVRRQKWPEGVTTPFEGYRAYRLYAIKRAMETRGNARLLRHEGWACHADLLRAVLPNARRVDVVDIDDRPDRLQRPRREKPFASAMQVRAMASGTEPPGLVGVDELDRIAQTASRSRERAAITAQSVQDGSGTGSRTNGSRTRQTARRDQGRTRSQANGSARSRPESGRTRPESGQSRQRSERSQQAAPGSGSKSAGGRARQPRSRSGGEGGPQQAAAAAPLEEQSQAEAVIHEGAVDPGEAQKPKRKRRRRKRGGQRTAGTEATSQDGPEGDAGPEAESPGGGADAADSVQQSAGRSRPEPPAGAEESDAVATGDSEDPAAEGASKKRRRRGGRRGGRGRRKPRPEGVNGEGVNAGSASAGSASGAAADDDRAGSAGDAGVSPAPEPVARVEDD